MQECRCDSFGSFNGFCNNETGMCVCRVGYDGSKCDKCAFGYYGYPRCRPCACNYAGSEPNNCNDTLCGCDPFGQCECKVINDILVTKLFNILNYLELT